MQSGIAILEDTLIVVFTKLTIGLLYDSAIVLPSIYPTELKISLYENLHMNVYGDFIYNCPDLETAKMFINRQ